MKTEIMYKNVGHRSIRTDKNYKDEVLCSTAAQQKNGLKNNGVLCNHYNFNDMKNAPIKKPDSKLYAHHNPYFMFINRHFIQLHKNVNSFFILESETTCDSKLTFIFFYSKQIIYCYHGFF